MASKQHGEQTVFVIDPVHTKATPDCRLCKRITSAGTLPKRLIVLCDGTSNASNQGVESHPTNVARLSRAIANVGYNSQGKPVPQISYYQAGIGSDPSITSFTKFMQQSFGDGLNSKVCEAYNYLANNYGPGDEIFVFGFSRGAYTARVLASFVCQFGLLTPGMMDYFDEIFAAYRKRKEKTFEENVWFQEFAKPGELGLEINSTEKITRMALVRRYTHMHVTIKAVGVFDTVGSIGLSGHVTQPGQDVDWHSSSLHPKIEYAFHALAIDEARGNFAPTLYYLYEDCLTAGTQLRQCWFPGYHGDIGGHSDPTWETNSIDLLTFAWMIDQLTSEGLLQFSKYQLYWPVLKRVHDGPVHTTHNAPRNVEEATERRIQWSDGKIKETNTVIPYYITSFLATLRLKYQRTPGEWKRADGHDVTLKRLCETVHPTVFHRMKHSNQKYQPKGLPAKEWKYEEHSESGPRWVRTVDGKEVASLLEYKFLDIEKRDFEEKDLWTGSLEKYLVPEDVIGHEAHQALKEDLAVQVQHLSLNA